MNDILLPGRNFFGEEARGGRESHRHRPDGEDGQQHRHAPRLGSQGPHDGLQHHKHRSVKLFKVLVCCLQFVSFKTFKVDR